MPEHGLPGPSRFGAARGPSVRDGTNVPDMPDTMWSTDLTAARAREGPAAVFIAVDHCSVEGIGHDRHRPVVAWRMP